MKGTSWAALSWQLISQMYHLHKMAYWKHVPPDQSTLLVIFMVYSYLKSTHIPVRFALWDKSPSLYAVHSSHVTKIAFQMCLHTKVWCNTHSQTHTLDTFILRCTQTHTHRKLANCHIRPWNNDETIFKKQRMQYSLIAKQISLSYMLKYMFLKVRHLVIASKKYQNKPNHFMDAVVHPQCFIVPVRRSMTFDNIYLSCPTPPTPCCLNNI